MKFVMDLRESSPKELPPLELELGDTFSAVARVIRVELGLPEPSEKDFPCSPSPSR